MSEIKVGDWVHVDGHGWLEVTYASPYSRMVEVDIEVDDMVLSFLVLRERLTTLAGYSLSTPVDAR